LKDIRVEERLKKKDSGKSQVEKHYTNGYRLNVAKPDPPDQKSHQENDKAYHKSRSHRLGHTLIALLSQIFPWKVQDLSRRIHIFHKITEKGKKEKADSELTNVIHLFPKQ